MIVKPYADRARRDQPVALCDHNGTPWNEHGNPAPIGHAAYIDRDSARVLITQGVGAGIYWRDRLIEWDPPGDRPPVRVLPAVDDFTFEDRLGGLVIWADWLRSYGVSVAAPNDVKAPASVGSASMRLLRASLHSTLYCSSPKVALPPIYGVLGGRQESMPPGTYQGEFHLWDMRAAYASTLARTPYGGGWRHMTMAQARKYNWARIVNPAFIHAEIRYNDLTDVGPLPKRPRGRRDFVESSLIPIDYPTTGRLFGTWTAAEVIAAERAGCQVRIIEAWKHFVDSSHLPFARWWDRIEEGRDLGGFAGTLAKITGNSLIGQFHIDTRSPKRRVWWIGGTKATKRIRHPGGVTPALDLAEHVTGTVRARLFSGVLWPHHGRVLAAHTDGAWVVGSLSQTTPRGPGWRHEDTAQVIDLIDSQHLAYRRPDEKVTRYVMAGFDGPHAALAMDELWTAQFGQGTPQRRTREFDHIPERTRDYEEMLRREGL